MTVELLERYVKSEVENLHLRIDALTDYVERIDQRLSRVERQLELLINSVEDIKVRLAYLEKNMVTKQDLQMYLTKDDAKRFLTKDDAKNFLTKEDAKNFLTKDDAKNFATKQDFLELKNLLLAFMKQFNPAPQ